MVENNSIPQGDSGGSAEGQHEDEGSDFKASRTGSVAEGIEAEKPQTLHTSACITCKTHSGMVDKEEVKNIKENISEDAPKVEYISINQTQEYFAIATKVGFEII